MRKYLGLFWCLLVLMLFFFVIELWIFLSLHEKSFLVGTIIHSHVKVPVILWGPVIIYWILLIGLHVLMAGAIFFVSYYIARLFQLPEKKLWLVGQGLLIVSIVELLLANQLLYPSSLYAFFTDWISYGGVFWLSKIGLGILLIACLMGILGFLKINLRKNSIIVGVILLFFLCSYFFYGAYGRPKAHLANPLNRPNIIIIGLDALRPDRTGKGPHGQVLMPNLNQFLSTSTVFDLSITPEARTHVAWMSILTGQLPKQNGVRFDLMRLPADKTTQTLSYILRQQGYETIYASDSSLFNPITSELSFDRVFTPPITADSFVVGLPSDFPVANLLMNTAIGQWLFPYTVNARDVSMTYDPSRYVKSLNRALSQETHRPIFLGIHLCLAHEPYGWKGHPYNYKETLEKNYDESVMRVDQQFGQLMRMLKAQGLLSHAIVIVMSDHGKSLQMHGDRLLKSENYQKGPASDPDTKALLTSLISYKTKSNALDIAFGHGTDVLSLSQYNNVLAFHAEGMPVFEKKHVPDMVLLSDIKPTILDLLHLPDHFSTTMSLVPYLYTHRITSSPRVIFVETGFTPSSFRGEQFSIFNTVVQTINLFEVDPEDDGVIMKSGAVQDLLRTNKERAVYYGDWILASYPQAKGPNLMILANRLTGKWTDDLNSKFAKTAPTLFMLNQLKTYYGSEME